MSQTNEAQVVATYKLSRRGQDVAQYSQMARICLWVEKVVVIDDDGFLDRGDNVTVSGHAGTVVGYLMGGNLSVIRLT